MMKLVVVRGTLAFFKRHYILVGLLAVGLVVLFIERLFGSHTVSGSGWLGFGNGLLLLALVLTGLRLAVETLPKIPETLTEAGSGTGSLRLKADNQRNHAQWFISMRWVAILVSTVLTVFSIKVVGWVEQKSWWPLMLMIGLLAASNVVYTALLRSRRDSSILLVSQAYLDLLIFTGMLQFSGGIENYLSTLMVLHVIIGGVLLGRQHCYGIAVAGTFLFALMAFGQLAEFLDHYSLDLVPLGPSSLEDAKQPVYVCWRTALQAALLFLTAQFVVALTERIREDERRLREMAERAQSERRLLERALETTGTGFRLLDPSLKLIVSNARWEEWFAPTPCAAASNGRMRFAESVAFARQAMLDKQTHSYEVHCCPEFENCGVRGGRPRAFQITCAPLCDSTGKISQVVELAQEITRIKEAQAKMVRAERLAAVGELAGAVAHEVNNPIAIISAKTSLLLEDCGGEMSPKVAQEVTKLNHLANRVARIAQGMLSYCRPSANTRQRLDLCQPIRRSLGMIEGHARRKKVKIEDLLGTPLPPVNANPAEMEQVFMNLFLNALDAMPNGGQLTVRSELPLSLAQGEKLIIAVEDTGTGIPESIRDRVFEPFFSTKKDGHGTGLGLSICLGILRSHGGDLAIENNLNTGTRMVVTMPLSSEASVTAGKKGVHVENAHTHR